MSLKRDEPWRNDATVRLSHQTKGILFSLISPSFVPLSWIHSLPFMVHLSPDSRLLVSLVKQEQAYANQLYNLLNASRSSLSSLVIYASSSPPPIAATLKAIAAALSGADDAFSAYAEALADWIEQLRAVSEKEEELTTIGRDREILYEILTRCV